jgi:hypothetical protein
MKKATYVGAWLGLKTGVTSTIAYMLIATIFDFILMFIFWGPSLSNIARILSNNLLNFTVFLIIPFAFICTATSIIFVIIIKTNPNLNEKFFTSICLIICLAIALTLYFLTMNMIYNIDDETMRLANIEIRTIPYTLFVVWGYFTSRKIYRTITPLFDGKSTPS